MVTFAQAQERAERWVNGEVPGPLRREVQVREFDLGFVAWAEPTAGGQPEGGRARLVIARDGESTLWPGLPVGEVIRRYEEEYGSKSLPAAPSSVAPQRLDLEATSFLLTPPGWLQEAADRRSAGTSAGAGAGTSAGAGAGTAAAAAGASPWDAADTSSSGGGAAQAPPATVFAPPLTGNADEEPASRPDAPLPPPPPNALPPPAGPVGDDVHHAPTMLTGPSTGGPGAVGQAAEDIADADTSRVPRGTAASRSGPSVPPPPGAPGTPGVRPDAGYVPAQMVSPDAPASPHGGVNAPGDTGSSGGSGGDVHHAATMLAGPGQGGPGVPAAPVPPPGVPAAPAPPPGVPGAPGAPSAPGTPPGPTHGPPPPPGAPPVAQAPPAYGYPQNTGVPTVGPGYMAVLRYRAPDGSEQQLIRRSAPGTPHPEWQILHELRGMNVPPQQVVELHTELEPCDLPGGYCARMIRETWPQVQVTHTASYGRDHASRQQGMRHLIEHQGELHQVADGPARPAPYRVPLPPQHQIPPMPPVPPDAIGQELLQAFGPQGVFRFDQHAVSRQGVPDVVGHTLVWAGLPREMGPFFWGQTQPGRPVPTLAELAQERGVQPGADAGSYLVMGNDFGRQLCVQFGTANIVAVPLEGAAGGQPAQPQFANTGLPEFVRCLAALARMWPLRYGLTQEQAGRWTVDFQSQLAALDPAALASPENWWSVLLEQLWDGLF